jgi:hypothetical protein
MNPKKGSHHKTKGSISQREESALLVSERDVKEKPALFFEKRSGVPICIREDTIVHFFIHKNFMQSTERKSESAGLKRVTPRNSTPATTRRQEISTEIHMSMKNTQNKDFHHEKTKKMSFITRKHNITGSFL